MLGNGGVFCWYSYINPLLTHVSGFRPESITLLMVLAGFGMVVGNLVSGSYAVAFWLGFVVIGLAVPFVLELMSRRGSQSKALPVAGEACVLVGGFMLRYLVIMAAVAVAVA